MADLFAPPVPRWTRRTALQHGMASFAVLCSLEPSRLARISGSTTSAGRRAARASALAPFRRELRLPPELVPVARTAAKDVYDVTIREGLADILPGARTPIYGYEGLFPGPTIRARRGRPVVVRVANELSFAQNMHLHGGHTPEDSDGGPHQLIDAGGSYTYRYPSVQDAATLWYHDHAHGLSARTMYYGLAGFYIVEDELEEELGLPRGEFDVPLMIQDRAFDEDGSLRYGDNLDQGVHGDTILVNGSISPIMRVKRGIYRLRFLNASNAREYQLRLGQGERMLRIAGDGGLLERAVACTSLPIAPAERVDVLVDFSRLRVGTELVLANALGEDERTMTVMRFDVNRARGFHGRLPDALRPRERIPQPRADRKWELRFGTSGTPTWQIGGLGFDPDRVDARVRLGTTERWRFSNPSHRPHPMHLHGAHFRVLDRSSGPVDPGDRGWKDTVMVRTAEIVTVQPLFAPYAGRYVFHCHNLEHQERAMMLQMEIAE